MLQKFWTESRNQDLACNGQTGLAFDGGECVDTLHEFLTLTAMTLGSRFVLTALLECAVVGTRQLRPSLSVEH